MARHDVDLNGATLANLKAESKNTGRPIKQILEELINRVYGNQTSRMDPVIALPYLQQMMTMMPQMVPAAMPVPQQAPTFASPVPSPPPTPKGAGFDAIRAAMEEDDETPPNWG